MSDTPVTIDSRDAFHARLTDLFAAAERSGVDVEGAYGVDTNRHRGTYDVVVSTVISNRR